MSRHPIDNLFRSQLAHRSESAPMQVWERVAAHRRRQRLKRLYWRVGGLTTSILGVGLLFFFAQSSKEVPRLAAFRVQKVPSDTSLPPTSPVLITDDAAVTAASNPLTVGVTAAAPTTGTAETTTTVLNTMNQKTQVSTPSSVQSRPAKASAGLEQKNHTTSKVGRSSSQPVVPASASIEEVPKVSERATPETVSPELEEAQTRQAEQQRTSGPHLRERNQQSQVVLPLPPRPFPQKLQKEPHPIPSSPASARCAKFGPGGPFVQVELLGGAAFGQSHFMARQSESSGHLEDRLRTESGGIGVQTNLRLSVVNHRGWSFRVGIGYSELRNPFRLETEGERTLTIRERYDANGNVIGRDTSFESSMITINRTNRYRFLEVPVSIGYEFRYGRMRLGVHGGPLFNLRFQPDGFFVSPATGEPISFGQESTPGVVPAYRSGADIGFYGGLTALYSLGGRYQLMIEPFFKSYPSSLTRTEYALEHTAWQTGLQLGLSMRL